MVKAERVRQRRSHVLDLNSQIAADDMPVFLELVHHRLGKIRRDRESDTLVAAGAAIDRSVYSDHLPASIEQGPPELPGFIEASVWMKVS